MGPRSHVEVERGRRCYQDQPYASLLMRFHHSQLFWMEAQAERGFVNMPAHTDTAIAIWPQLPSCVCAPEMAIEACKRKWSGQGHCSGRTNCALTPDGELNGRMTFLVMSAPSIDKM